MPSWDPVKIVRLKLLIGGWMGLMSAAKGVIFGLRPACHRVYVRYVRECIDVL
ncbi:uncharacterized protein BP01DRAFT_358409 [Aspergillus saccharolyticus JOP 1030-1]|uniref:Uncharacterized protein n=1 Tax=Aspergillus saccharolyticus JOP 1030-1 TaxID=1450539 RepID=A0A318ZBH4_9EURO|nr:hypothetical protein BP01DRAFT_358409 [Aspergillus saccharolyticus JOP 1030-1]PYH43684.1 hypothetical protein BP01DRAFT_358409 [Aspergillus saccharolyticus JOP 1030-1]